RGQANVNNLIGKLRRQEEDFIVLDSTSNFGTVGPNQEVNNSSYPYRFQISSQPSDTLLSFLLHLTGTNYQNFLFFTLGMGSFTGIKADKLKSADEIRNVPTFLRKEKFPKGIEIFDFLGRKVDFRTGTIKKGIYFLKFQGRIRKAVVI
ncbi:MAG: hypothetical protein ABIK81_02250, partial [candidate division WOR-3 bacterium]